MVIFLYCLADTCNAQIRMGAGLEAMGNTSSTITNTWSAWHNPAGLSGIDQKSIALSYRILQDIEGFNSVGIAYAHPLKVGTLGIGISRFGDQLYNEQQVSLTYANKFGITELGVEVAYHQYHFEGFGNKAVPVISFGGITELSSQFYIGAFIQNINQAKLSDFQDERIPTIMQLGVSYRPLDNIMINIDLQKDIDFDTSVLIGLSYAVIDNLKIMTGINTSPNRQFFGLTFDPHNIRGEISYTLSNQEFTGLSHQISLQYGLTK